MTRGSIIGEPFEAPPILPLRAKTSAPVTPLQMSKIQQGLVATHALPAHSPSSSSSSSSSAPPFNNKMQLLASSATATTESRGSISSTSAAPSPHSSNSALSSPLLQPQPLEPVVLGSKRPRLSLFVSSLESVENDDDAPIEVTGNAAAVSASASPPIKSQPVPLQSFVDDLFDASSIPAPSRFRLSMEGISVEEEAPSIQLEGEEESCISIETSDMSTTVPSASSLPAVSAAAAPSSSAAAPSLSLSISVAPSASSSTPAPSSPTDAGIQLEKKLQAKLSRAHNLLGVEATATAALKRGSYEVSTEGTLMTGMFHIGRTGFVSATSEATASSSSSSLPSDSSAAVTSNEEGKKRLSVYSMQTDTVSLRANSPKAGALAAASNSSFLAPSSSSTTSSSSQTSTGAAAASALTSPHAPTESEPKRPHLQISEDTLVEMSLLGRGAGGKVLKALHVPSLTLIALKCIDVSDKSKRNQLLKELKELDSDFSPYIVAFYGAYYVDRDFTVKLGLEYMNRGSLQSLLSEVCVADFMPQMSSSNSPSSASSSSCGGFHELALSALMRQVLLGLSHLHRRKKCHRDIKPGNLLLNHFGVCKVSDFGLLAELADSQAKCETFIGTMVYMSPERLTSESYGYPADIWSLGLTLITLLLGKYPLNVDDGYWGLVMHFNTQPTPHLLMNWKPAATIPSSPSMASTSDSAKSTPASDLSSTTSSSTSPVPGPQPLPGEPFYFTPECHDFISHCLEKEPAKRWSAQELLEHPWISVFACEREESLTFWPARARMAPPDPQVVAVQKAARLERVRKYEELELRRKKLMAMKRRISSDAAASLPTASSASSTTALSSIASPPASASSSSSSSSKISINPGAAPFSPAARLSVTISVPSPLATSTSAASSSSAPVAVANAAPLASSPRSTSASSNVFSQAPSSPAHSSRFSPKKKPLAASRNHASSAAAAVSAKSGQATHSHRRKQAITRFQPIGLAHLQAEAHQQLLSKNAADKETKKKPSSLYDSEDEADEEDDQRGEKNTAKKEAEEEKTHDMILSPQKNIRTSISSASALPASASSSSSSHSEFNFMSPSRANRHAQIKIINGKFNVSSPKRLASSLSNSALPSLASSLSPVVQTFSPSSGDSPTAAMVKSASAQSLATLNETSTLSRERSASTDPPLHLPNLAARAPSRLHRRSPSAAPSASSASAQTLASASLPPSDETSASSPPPLRPSRSLHVRLPTLGADLPSAALLNASATPPSASSSSPPSTISSDPPSTSSSTPASSGDSHSQTSATSALSSSNVSVPSTPSSEVTSTPSLRPAGAKTLRISTRSSISNTPSILSSFSLSELPPVTPLHRGVQHFASTSAHSSAASTSASSTPTSVSSSSSTPHSSSPPSLDATASGLSSFLPEELEALFQAPITPRSQKDLSTMSVLEKDDLKRILMAIRDAYRINHRRLSLPLIGTAVAVGSSSELAVASISSVPAASKPIVSPRSQRALPVAVDWAQLSWLPPDAAIVEDLQRIADQVGLRIPCVALEFKRVCEMSLDPY